jgi:hypothetical protein
VEARKAAARECQERFHAFRQAVPSESPREAQCNARAEPEAALYEFNGTIAAIDRFRSTAEQDGLRAARRETNRMHGRLTHRALQQAGEKLAQLVE